MTATPFAQEIAVPSSVLLTAFLQSICFFLCSFLVAIALHTLNSVFFSLFSGTISAKKLVF